MFERCLPLENLISLHVELDDLDLVLYIFQKGTNRKSVRVVGMRREPEGVDDPGSIVCDNLAVGGGMLSCGYIVHGRNVSFVTHLNGLQPYTSE